MKKLLSILFVLLCASPTWAQYNSKKVAAVDAADDKGQIHVVVVFSGTNVNAVKREYFPTDIQAFRQQVAADLAELNKKQTSAKDLVVGAEVPDPGAPDPPPPPPPPDPDEVASVAFQANIQAWQVANAKQVVGLADQAAVDAALAALQSAYAKGTPTQQALFDLRIFGSVRFRGSF